MTKKLFKKSLACLIAVMMIVTSLPLNALALDFRALWPTTQATEDFNVGNSTKSGLIANNSSRLDGSKGYNIVNDQQDDNFTAAFWSFNIEEIGRKDATVKTATFTATVTADPLSDCQGLTFYYAGNSKTDALGSGQISGSSVMGTTNEHQDKTIQLYDLTPIATYPKVALSNGYKMTFDIKDAMNACLARGLSTCTIFLMQSQAGGNAGTNDWTDTWVSSAATVTNCVIQYDDVQTDPGLEGLKQAMSVYENKMSKIGSDGILVYKNMTAAYNAYLKACRVVDAYEYGHNTSVYSQFDSIKAELLDATSSMTSWKDTVSGTYGSDANSKVPTFQDTDANTMKGFPNFYGNILYTEHANSNMKNYDNENDTTSNSGASVIFDKANGLRVIVYYPNMVLLYDGSNNAVFPVAFRGRKDSGDRFVYTLYPAKAGATSTYTTTAVGNSSELQSLALTKNDDSYNFKGKDGANSLDWDYAREQTNIAGSSAGNPWKHWSGNFGRAYVAAAFGQRSYWNTYATSFQVTDSIDFKGEGYKDLNPYWAWYGGTSGNADASVQINSNMCGYKQGDHKIYVLNYKLLADTLKDNSLATRLNDVANYTEGGLLSVIQAYDQATSFVLGDVNLNNVATKGNEIKNSTNAIKGNATSDADKTSYANLKTAILKAQRVYNNGNENNENYTAESWAPFKTAYEGAERYFSNLATGNINTADAAQYIAPLTDAQAGLVLNREVVDTTILEYAIDNADAIIANVNNFKSGTVTIDLVQMVEDAKNEIWKSSDNYGLESEKLIKNAANQAIVDGWLTKIVAEVAKAQIDTTTLQQAIDSAASYEAVKNNYSNYSTLQTAVNNGKAFIQDVPTINARIEGQVANTLASYNNYVDSINYAILTLRKSFTLVENGSIANPGNNVTTRLQPPQRGDQFNFYWKHSSGIVYFKTEREALEIKLPVSEWGSYNKQTGNYYDSLLDSINLHAADVDEGELTSKSAAFSNTPGGYGMTATQISERPGNLAITNSNLGLTLNNFKVKQATSATAGVDSAGNGQGLDYDFTDALSVTDGAEPRIGGILAKNGTTIFNCDANISVPATTGAPNADNKTSVKSKKMDLAASGTEIGMVYFWRLADVAVVNYAGYGFTKSSLDLSVGVVDLCTLFDLIEQCESDDVQSTANNYTTASWNAFLKAIANAKSDMSYGSMSYEEIVAECDRRYAALLSTRNALETPASNAKLKAAVLAAKSIYENDEAKVDPSTWGQFVTAYETALSKYQGIYSDTGVRDFAKTEQSVIDALATALTDAQNALAYLIDFSVVDNSVFLLVRSIADNKFTATSVDALKDAIANLTYYNMPEAERKTYFTNNTAVAAAVKNEAEVIVPGLLDSLVDGTGLVDDSALQAAKEYGKSKLSDPDAYDQAEIKAALALLDSTADVTLMGRTIKCFKYDTQAEIDSDVSDALSGISIQNYTVTCDGKEVGTYPYGTEITVKSENDEFVDWYYASTSNTSTTAKKYFASDKEVTFIVKGNTTLTTKKAAAESQQVKVTVVNSLNSRTLAVDYVEAGTAYSLADIAIPGMVYYEFTGYTVAGTTYPAGSAATVTVNANTTIALNYELKSDADSYTVYVADLNYGWGEYNLTIGGLKYNDEVKFIEGTAEADDGYIDTNLNYYVNGEKFVEAESGRYGLDAVYAWIQVQPEDADAFVTWCDEASNYNIINGQDPESRSFTELAAEITHGKVVAYGPDYTFRVHENVALLPLDKPTYDLAVELGVVEDYGEESNGATITTSDEVLIVPGEKFSIVSSFALPDDCEFVECGILFAANKNSSTKPEVELTLGNVGTNGLVRAKSTSRTKGDQFVISIGSKSLVGKKVGDVGMVWAAYLIYKDKDGELQTLYTAQTSPVNTQASF